MALENYTPPLFVLHFDELNLMADSLFKEMFEEDPKLREAMLTHRVQQFVADSDSGYSKKLKLTELSEITGMKTRLILNGLTLRIRDIPLKILDLNLVHWETSLLNLRYVS